MWTRILISVLHFNVTADVFKCDLLIMVHLLLSLEKIFLKLFFCTIYTKNLRKEII